jgi:hypothetical protein
MVTYQPAEMTALLASKARRSCIVYAPYVYRSEREIAIDHQSRAHAVLFSGAQNASIYPVRSKMGRIRKYWPPLRLMSTMLPHPGYPDIGQERKHGIVGGLYVAHLAQFRFAAICSSRCRLEFLKYREFAYAGVVPVGDMPATLLDCPTDAWFPLRRNFIAFTNALKSARDTALMAMRFRQFMRERREVDTMREMVTHQLERVALA